MPKIVIYIGYIMASIFYHLKKALGAYRANLSPYLISFFIVGFSTIFIFLIGILIVLFTSQNIIYSDDFINNVSGAGPAEFLAALATPLNIVVLFTFSALALAAGVYLSSGLCGVCLEGIRGRASMRTFFGTIYRRGSSYLLAIFSIFVVWLLMIVLSVVPVMFALSLGGIFSEVPFFGMYVILLFAMWFLVAPFVLFVPVAVVWGKNVSEALHQNFLLGRENYFEILALEAIFYAIIIAAELIPYGFVLQIFLVIPLLLFALSSYYIDISRAKIPFEAKAPATKSKVYRIREDSEFPIETVVPKPRKARLESKPIHMDKRAGEILRQEEIKPQPKIASQKPSAPVHLPAKQKKKKKHSVYIVARKAPVRIAREGSGRKKHSAKPKHSKAKGSTGKKSR